MTRNNTQQQKPIYHSRRHNQMEQRRLRALARERRQQQQQQPQPHYRTKVVVPVAGGTITFCVTSASPIVTQVASSIPVNIIRAGTGDVVNNPVRGGGPALVSSGLVGNNGCGRGQVGQGQVGDVKPVVKQEPDSPQSPDQPDFSQFSIDNI